MEYPENRIQERNKEIGQIIREARNQKNISVTTCAKLIGTSRRRYIAMEQGEAVIGIAELEILMSFLGVPTNKIWSGNNLKSVPHQIKLEAVPGETMHIIVDVQSS
jgi:transcriptional regulator with XRE-family HTH domain